MLSLLAALVFGPPDVRIDSAEDIGSLAWHPDGKRLFYVTARALHEWPKGRSFPLATSPARWLKRLRFSPGGKRLLISGTYADRAAIVDLAAGTVREIRQDAYFRWWIGNHLASVLPEIKKESWTGRQFLEYKSKRHALPPGWEFAAADSGGTVLLAKKRGWFEGPIALFRLDQVSLSTERISSPQKKLYIEYIEQDSLAWHEKLYSAAIGLTCDTGASLARLSFLRDGKITFFPARGNLFFLHSEPKWIGQRVLANIREFREFSTDDKGFGADIYRIQLIDPMTLTAQTLVKQENRWTWTNRGALDNDRTGLDEIPNRNSMPDFGAVDMTPNGKRLAWTVHHRGKNWIMVRQLP